jgi:hypothetical protein
LRSPRGAGRSPGMTTPTPATGTIPPTGAYAADAALTLLEIADLLGRDPSTIKDWNDKGRGKWPNAKQDKHGRHTWRVPVGDLVATGDLDASQVAHVENELAARRESRETRALREQVVRLEEQVTAALAMAKERARTITLLRGLLGKGGVA